MVVVGLLMMITCLNVDTAVVPSVLCTISDSSKKMFTIDKNLRLSPLDLKKASMTCTRKGSLSDLIASQIPDTDRAVNETLQVFDQKVTEYSWLFPLLREPNGSLETLKSLDSNLSSIPILQILVSNQSGKSIVEALGRLPENRPIVENFLSQTKTKIDKDVNSLLSCKDVGSNYLGLLTLTCGSVQRGLDRVFFLTLLLVILGSTTVILMFALYKLYKTTETDASRRRKLETPYGPFM